LDIDKDDLSLDLKILDAIGLPITVKNRQGEYVYVNQKASEVLDLPKEKIMGQTVYEIAPVKQADHCTKDDTELFATGIAQTHKIFVKTNTYSGVAQFNRKIFVSEHGDLIVEIVRIISKVNRELFNTLSDREFEVLMLIKQGRVSKQIAQTLFVSTHTVNDYKKSINKKLGVRNKTQLFQKTLGSKQGYELKI